MKQNKKNNIILIGCMGSGKTVIGKNVAKQLGYIFADTDEMISEVTNLSLPKLFHKHGEIRFRSEERLILQKLAQKQEQVIAWGGSLPPDQKDIDLLDPGFFVFVKASPRTILSRISRKNDRLIIGGKPTEESILSMLEQRFSVFESKIAYTVDTDQFTVEEAAERIVTAYQRNTEE